MNYGSSAYGSVTIGGAAGSNVQVFFPFAIYASDVLHQATAFFSGNSEFYEIKARQAAESGASGSGIEYKVYCSHGEGETPQLQAAIGGNTRVTVPALAIIVVTALIDSAVWGSSTIFEVTGKPYTG